MKEVNKKNVILTFSSTHKPAMTVDIGETVAIEAEDAFGGQIRSEKDSVETLDWSKVDGATGPLYIEGAMSGDTLVVEVLKIEIPAQGVIVTIPKQGILEHTRFKATTKIVKLDKREVKFEQLHLKTNPMIGTIGVAPEGDPVSCGSLGKHGGNMDVKELTAGTKLYLPVFVKGGLFAAGDIHAVQADGELCVSAIEVPGKILLKFNVIKGKRPDWPVLETEDSYAFLACGKTLDEAARHAADAAVGALTREMKCPFEVAYMFGSLAVDLEINQVVDPKKGVRAVVSKDFLSIENILV